MAKYSNEEDEIIKQNYKKISTTELAEMLPGRSPSSIRNRAFELGLTEPKFKWTPEKEAILKQYCETETLTELQKRFPDLTEDQIKNKIHNLGLAVYKEERKYWENGVYWTPEREEKLRETYPTEGSAAVRHFPGMTKQAVMAKASALDIKYIKIRPWTPEEEDIMRTYYPSEGGKVINRLSGRKLTDIYSKASEMGLIYVDPNRWTEDEIEIMKEFYPSATKQEMLELLPGRNYETIKSMAQRLKLHKDRNWSDEEVKILKKFYPVEGPSIIVRLPKRTRASIICKARLLNLKCRESGAPWTTEETEILKKYYNQENIVRLAKRLPKRTYNAIKSKAFILGLTKSINNQEDLNDTVSQENNNVVETSSTEVKVEKSNSSISSKKLRKWKVGDVEILEKYYPIEGTAVFNRLKKYTMNQIRKAVTTLGLKMNKIEEPWAVEEDYLACEFYLKHVNDWNTKESVEELHRIFISKGFLTHGIKTIHMKLANCSYIHKGIGLEHASQQNIDVYNKLTGGNLFTRFFRWLRRIFKI